MITNFQIQYEYYGYTICMKPFTLTPRDIGAVHMCHIMCQPIYELFRPHSQHLQTPINDVYHESHGKRDWQKMLMYADFGAKFPGL